MKSQQPEFWEWTGGRGLWIHQAAVDLKMGWEVLKPPSCLGTTSQETLGLTHFKKQDLKTTGALGSAERRVVFSVEGVHTSMAWRGSAHFPSGGLGMFAA